MTRRIAHATIPRMAKSASQTLKGLEYLLAPNGVKTGALCAVVGDEPFLKREVLRTLQHALVGDGDGEFGCSTFYGKEAQWREVSDSLDTVSLFGSEQQIAIVEEADPFVTAFRSQLETYVERSPAGSVLVLDVKLWPSNTRLAKATAEKGLTINCTAPERGAELGAYKRLAQQWLAKRATEVHGAKLQDAATNMLFDLLPMSLGLLDQEVAKLALMAGEAATIDPKLVHEHVGGWRVRTAWEMIDAIANGAAADALTQLDRLLASGEQPIAVFAQVSSSLRKFGAAAEIVQQAEREGRRADLGAALESAGIPKFKLGDAQKQLRQIGRQRALTLTERLLQMDLALKGHNSSPSRARLELERLIVELSPAALAK